MFQFHRLAADSRAGIRRLWLSELILLTGLWLTSCSVQAQTADEQLQQLFADEWQRTLREDPEYASRLGDSRYGDRWADRSLPVIRQSQQRERVALQRARRISPLELSAANRLNREVFLQEYESRVRLQEFQLYLLPLNQREGIQDISSLADLLSFDTAENYQRWIARLRGLPLAVARTMALMKQGMREQILHPAVVMKRVPDQIRRQIVDDPELSLFWKPFRSMPDELTAAEQDRLRAAARQAIRERVVPAWRRFLEFFEQEYLPACFEQAGCWQRNQGEAAYAELARHFTTTDLSPDELHQIGLREVERILKQMEAIQQQVGFVGSLQEFFVHLRSAPRFYATRPQDLLQAYRDCCAEIRPALPALFHRLPQVECVVKPIPDQMAPDTTTAYYQPPSADGRRPGAYYVNLYRPDSRPLYEVAALTLHESLPGHHLQIALAMEQEDLPEFRRNGLCTAFVEGWGLYSEKLGEELGVYTDPYAKFGQLTYEMWRAVRLVVDTGMHHHRWSRQQAIDYFMTHTAKTPLDIVNEVDRYIAWPGQALAYKTGELKIRELRQRAEQQLGMQFDVRDFHDAVLKQGAVPLTILERQVDDWLQEQLRHRARERGEADRKSEGNSGG